MSADLKSQIHAYGAELVDSQRPITDADIAELLGKVREMPPTPVLVREKPRPWVAVAAGVAVLVLFGGLSLLLATSGPEAPPATTPSTVTSVTSPQTTTSLAAEDSGSAVGVTTYQDLPNQSSIGWEWYETGLESETSFERGDNVWRLGNGTYVAYNQGFNGILTQEDGTETFVVDLPGQSGAGSKRVDDPEENFYLSTDGTTWNEVSLDRFEGFAAWAHLEIPGGAPYLYVSVHPVGADRGDPASWSTWATDDGETWFEVLVDDESAGTYFMEYAQIGQRAVARSQGTTSGILVSSDGGRSYTSVDAEIFQSNTLRNPAATDVFVHDGKFRTLAWNQSAQDMATSMYKENPVLWESSDGFIWTAVGPTSGLDPQPDGRGLIGNSDRRVESLADGGLLLVGAEPTRVTFDDDLALYALQSADGGLNWRPIDNVPTSPNRRTGLLVYAPTVTSTDNWVVITTDEVTLATDGNTWILFDGPPYAQQNPIGLRGAVMSGWDMGWILLPSR